MARIMMLETVKVPLGKRSYATFVKGVYYDDDKIEILPKGSWCEEGKEPKPKARPVKAPKVKSLQKPKPVAPPVVLKKG